MSFTTLPFLFFFLLLLVIYYVVPKYLQWVVLLIGSYFFYYCFSWKYAIVLMIVTLVSYSCALMIQLTTDEGDIYLKEHKETLEKEEKKAYKKKIEKKKSAWLIAGIVCELGILAVFKYAGFFLGAFVSGSIFDKLVLPVGLSFYTFQSLGYLIDVQRGMVEAQKNPFKFAMFVSYFPQLLQGPIGDYNRLSKQFFEGHSFDIYQIKLGVQRIGWGFFKKLVIANRIGGLLPLIMSNLEAYSGVNIWLVLVLYGIELYADFAGYMDIALGVSQCFGITLDENFTQPYFAYSISDFWRKWHITLGAWFRNYLFYPLQRTKYLTDLRKKYRKSNPYLSAMLPNVISLCIVWVLIGLWHGGAWSYVLYGIYHGSFIVAESILDPVYKSFHNRFPGLKGSVGFKGFQMVRTFILVCIGYLLFYPANLGVTVAMIKAMFSGFGLGSCVAFITGNLADFGFIGLGTCLILADDIWHVKHPGVRLREVLQEKPWIIRWSFYVVGFLLVFLFGLYGGEYDASSFIYFQF